MRNSHFNILQINNLLGQPLFPPNQEMYRLNSRINAQEIEDINFEDIPKVVNPPKWNEKNFEEDPYGDDLDVPGAEDDDEQEDIGNEDEENNYYSLAQDEQSDIDESLDQ